MACAWVSAGASAPVEIQPLLSTYCVKCHGAEKAKAGVNLERFTDVESIHKDPVLWEKILSQIRDREMPPENKPQPTPEERERMAVWVEKTLDSVDWASAPKNPGRVVLHRLSRLEYNNSVRDLFGVTNRPADRFPADGGGGGGFDNNADYALCAAHSDGEIAGGRQRGGGGRTG